MPPDEVYEKVPLPLIYYFEHCYYVKNGRQCRYADPVMNQRYLMEGDPMLAIERTLS